MESERSYPKSAIDNRQSSVGGSCDAVVAGHICLDIIPAISGSAFSFQPGQLLEVGPAVLSTGGPVSNTGLALHKLGIPTRLMGKVGNDPIGELIRAIVASHVGRLQSGMIEASGEASSYTVILNPPGCDRMFLHCPGCNDTFGKDDIDYGTVADARLFHFGYPPLLRHVIENGGEELVEILKRARAAGAATSLDLCMPDPGGFSGSVDWPGILSAALPHVDIFLPSLEEILFMLYPRRFAELRDGAAFDAAVLSSVGSDLLALGPAVVGLKLGVHGLYLRTAGSASWPIAGRAQPGQPRRWLDRELWSPCFRVQVAGTTGAGDATIAGFLAAFLRGCSPEECVTMACAVGACNVEAADALGGLQDWDSTRSRVAAGWPRAEVPDDRQGWRRIADGGILSGPRDGRETE